MENVIGINSKVYAETVSKQSRKAAPVRKIRDASVNLIRQFPERPGEWGNRLVIVVLAGENKAQA